MKTRIEEHFDVSSIIGIEITDKRETSYRWLPKKQKTFFFGMWKRDAWHSEGFYDYGYYYEGYMGDSWDATPYTKEDLIMNGYIVDENNVVWRKPYATVYLRNKYEVTTYFNTFEDSIEWCENLKLKSGKKFEIVRHEK